MSKKVKAKLLNWFRMIDKELSKLPVGGQAPVVIAGVESLCSLYREASTYPHLVDKGISGNPEELKSEELHSQGYGLVRPVFMKARERRGSSVMAIGWYRSNDNGCAGGC